MINITLLEIGWHIKERKKKKSQTPRLDFPYATAIKI